MSGIEFGFWGFQIKEKVESLLHGLLLSHVLILQIMICHILPWHLVVPGLMSVVGKMWGIQKWGKTQMTFVCSARHRSVH